MNMLTRFCLFLRRNFSRKGASGFTLLELIITLVLSAIVGVMLVQFMSSSLLGTVEPVFLLQENTLVVRAMENINAEYRSQWEDDTFAIDTFKNNLQSYAGVDDVTVTGTYISFTDDGVESTTPDPHFLKVIVTASNMKVMTVFSD